MSDSVREAPTTVPGILKQLGPGLIVAGSIVGSGELIATTLTGAEAGFWLMWLILLGCAIKVFAQLELGRYSLATGRTTLDGLQSLPGFKPAGLHWIIWLWVLMFMASVAQSGGIVGAVGQSLSIAAPLTSQGEAYNAWADANVNRRIGGPEAAAQGADAPPTEPVATGPDVLCWALVVSVATSVLLLAGRYQLIERLVLVLVGGFTLLSVANLVMLQLNPSWAVTLADLGRGLSFRLPPPQPGLSPVATALATFGLIGVGSGELVYYPYWCLQKGYARHVGPADSSEAWTRRAQGWMRVMKWDAWCSMAVYTLSTMTFYLLGAAVLHRARLIPDKSDLIRTLAAMYEPAFGGLAVGLFLVGAVAVLYSTFLVASASNALVFADALAIFTRNSPRPIRQASTWRWLGVALPLVSFTAFLIVRDPKLLILISGVAQTIMLPALAGAALYFRYRYAPSALRPHWAWDVGLWLSAIALVLVGGWCAAELVSSW
ncbi:Natural resistance-associated macrophage protein [Pirellulimonas nuda]|uniref:Natural resistance-associated macrophage protein n=1 Tax=Pirellulimonas nuda TaxID=2528009 RepID=A0A518DCK5_9BACT|nr:Nramp family divalent metal transporter [Pirellulimonas nuda]QDU89208.1 Natural resistance-associated macrophage protein [Pirellulimonas nuda]